MRLSLVAALFLASPALAAQVAGHSCQIFSTKAFCEIRLQGKVSESDLLFLSHVHDRDELSFQGTKLGSTGTFLRRPFHAGFFPRVYSLQAIAGLESPTLTLEAQGGLIHKP